VKRRTSTQRFLLAFLAPAAVLYTIFVALPGLRALLYSLQKWDGFRDIQWAGLDNFRALFQDDLFLQALKHNAILLVLGGTCTISLALFFAAALNRRVHGSGVFRVAFFFPNVLASVAVAVLWIQLYSTNDFGLLNALLKQIQRAAEWVGIPFMEDQLPYSFLETSHLIYAIVPMLVWTATGFYMVLFLAAMEGIPEELYEAARIDGASPRRQFFSITLPLIREVFVVAIVFFIIASAKFFDPVWVMENSYPTADSHVMATVLYQKVFSEYNVGYAAAVAVVLFAMVFVATLITLRWSRKEALEF
jgi:ABC-type sugar transport system permease subunit